MNHGICNETITDYLHTHKSGAHNMRLQLLIIYANLVLMCGLFYVGSPTISGQIGSCSFYKTGDCINKVCDACRETMHNGRSSAASNI